MGHFVLKDCCKRRGRRKAPRECGSGSIWVKGSKKLPAQKAGGLYKNDDEQFATVL
jgi:hypothetical protein